MRGYEGTNGRHGAEPGRNIKSTLLNTGSRLCIPPQVEQGNRRAHIRDDHGLREGGGDSMPAVVLQECAQGKNYEDDFGATREMNENNSIAILTNANKLLAQVRTVQDAEKIISVAEAARVYAQQEKLGSEAQNYASEIKIRAQRLAGLILRDSEKAKGGQPYQEKNSTPPTPGRGRPEAPTYSDMDISYKDASRWQNLADMPEEIFEKEIKENRNDRGELLSSAIYREARKLKQHDPVDPPSLPEGVYDIILADPPWRYEHEVTLNRAVENHYPTMELGDICDLDIESISGKDSVLFLWTTNPKLEESLQVINSWGFQYRTNMVWIKDKIGMGYYVRAQHELLLIARKGEPGVPDPENRCSSIFAKREEHSKKPGEFYEIIEKMYPASKKVELFAREARIGWDMWGTNGNT